MGLLSRSLPPRVRWALGFALLLLASSAGPVLAESPQQAVGPARVAEEPPPITEDVPPADEGVPPAPEETQPETGQIAEQVESSELEVVARDKWLESPEAARQREESRTGFDDLSAVDAEGALSSTFQEMLKQLDGDPARALSDMQVEEVVGEYGAVVVGPDGGTELLESPFPIRSQVAGEEGKVVDLDLRESPGGFESKTPAAEIELPGTLGGEIKVGEVAVSSLPGSGEVAATRFGDKDLFFANTDTDTDTFLAPLATGVEIFQQLRSPKSPEVFRYGLTLPKGAILRTDNEGGAEIVDPEGNRIAAIPAPVATDAQGTAVPITMALEESSVIVQIAHQSMDVAYPILMDPVVDDAWYWETNGPAGLEQWYWTENADYESGHECVKKCWGLGLYARSKGENYWYGANTYGHWTYQAPNTTAYIAAATFWTIKGETYNCLTHQPHGYVGIYNVNSGTWPSVGVWSPPQGYSPNFQTGWVGGPGTRLGIVGIGTGGSPSQLACGHDFWVAGAMLNQDDPESPTAWGTGLPNGGGWFSEDDGTFNLGSHAYDPGLGVKKITLTREGQPNSYEWPVGCNGTAASRCPENRSEYVNVSAHSFDEGKNKATLTAEDATGKISNSVFYTYVDMTKPEVDLSGQLATATKENLGEVEGNKDVEELSLPVYNLSIKATDVGTYGSTEKRMRSGVRKMEIWLDKEKVQEWTQPCPDTCSMEKSYALKLNNLESGEHKLRVLATDGVNKTREREIEFEFIPATGMKEEYVMQYFPLPDGSGNEAEEENPDRPELAVNVINGNLVYREKDVDVEGYAVNLEVERYYNSLLPEEENTEWGDGWTLAQTPELEPDSGPGAPEEALMVRPSGAVEGAIELPTVVGGEKFDPELQAVVSKEADGGFEVTDVTGEADTSLAFDEEGTVEELRTDGEAAVEYDFSGGDLQEIAVDDPGSVTGNLEEIVERDTLEDITPTYKSSFGSQGAGNGQFKVLTDIATDPTDGSLWATDDENNRIQHFSAAGAYLGQFPSCLDPGAVELNASGDLFVACSGSGSVRRYSDSGTLLKTLATFGAGNAQVRFPLDLAFDHQGNLLVADNENDRLVKFDSAGNWLKAIPLGTWGRPWGLAVAANGNILVAEPLAQRVSILDPNGTRVDSFGSMGTQQGEFDRPTDVEVDHNGYIFVSDPGNRRVQVFNPQAEYVAQFGEPGTGAGQFSTDHWMRIATNAGGEIFVTDQGGSRVQLWTGSNYHASYKASFGSQGTGNGQFKVLTDVGTDPTDGSLWVTDDDNDRIQHFSATGTYLGKFATCLDPGAVELNAVGDLFVACSGSGSVRKYSDTGTLLKTLATFGSGNGQVRFPLDLTFNSEGKLWVADNENERLVQFDAAGNWIKAVPLAAWSRPWGIAADADGNIWAAEPIHHRVSVYSPSGAVLNQFGTQGSGPGQFEWPSDVEIDPQGYAWVPDGGNNRVQIFNPQGEYVTRFGKTGSGAGEFNTYWWMRLSMNAEGDLFITDQGNSRVVRWQEPPRLRLDYVPKYNNDPNVEVDVAGGLVESVEGLEAGEHVYGHSGDLLTSHTDTAGKSEYQYDGSGRMTYVKLPNGTWAKIAYGATDGRVTSVEVAPYGTSAKKTSFQYEDVPRRTKVILPLDPVVTYDIGEDGSVLISRNAVVPPEFKLFTGTFYDKENRETNTPINKGDYALTVEAYSIEGIRSIYMYANGNQIISEKTCPQVDENPTACKTLPDEWVAHTDDLPPGILNLEVVIEDRTKKVSSKRFWVNIPYTPPPPPDQMATPKHADVLKFREEHGLDLDLDPIQDELELNDRVYDTINDWIQGDPVAVASQERWGSPLRTPEVAELDWRLAYWQHDSLAIQAWAEAHASSSFAGYYLDERAGGVMRVGFTSGQQERVAELASSGGLQAPTRVAGFPSVPKHTLAGLETLKNQIFVAAKSYPSGTVNRVSVDVIGNRVQVGSSNVSQATSLLASSFGPTAPINVINAPPLEGHAGRERVHGPMLAGDRIWTKEPNGEEWACSSAFGAFDQATKPATGQPVWRMFFLTAAHCAEEFPGSISYRTSVPEEAGPKQRQKLGTIKRTGWDADSSNMDLDIEAIRFEGVSGIEPRRIYSDPGVPPIDVTGAGLVRVGTRVCYSGATTDEAFPSGVKCGTVFELSTFALEGHPAKEWCFDRRSLHGDSGGPIWIEGTGIAVGVLSAGDNTITCFSPLLPDPEHPDVPSAFSDSRLAPLDGLTTR